MISKRFTSTPCYGFIPKGAEMFRDPELFEQDMWAYEILNKIKIWYGTVKSNDDNIKGKAILGIQCVYVDLITGNKTTTEQHCGDLSNKDIEVKELELKDNDYFNKCYLDFDFGVTHLKLTTFKGESIELGVEKDDTKKTVDINIEKEPQILHIFYGHWDKYCLRALGFKYISKKNFILVNLMGILRLRHLFQINEEERKKWENPEELNKLNLKMKAAAKVCLLPDKTFFSVIQFCGM